MKWGEKLILLRKKRGMSQAKLAEELGLSRQTISKWENGAGEPSATNLNSISILFGVPIETLVDDRMEIPIDSASQIEAGLPEVLPPLEESAAGNNGTDDRRKVFLTFMKGVICIFCALAAVVIACIGVYYFAAHELEDNIIPIEEAQRDKIELLPNAEIKLSPID